jgi:hypothetical protein
MAHGFLSYQDTRGEVDWLGKTLGAIKDYLDNREKKEKVADMVAAKVNVLNDQKALPQGQTPLLRGGNEKQIAGTPLQKMLGGTALQKSLPGAVAKQPDVVGGPLAKAGFSGRRLKPEGFVSDQIVDIGATNLGYERDLGGSDMFVKTLSDVSGDSSQVVQAIDRLTMVTMTLVSATQEQTNSQKQIAAAQQQHSDKLARKSIAAAEETSLEQGGDFSSNAAYLALAGQGMMGRRGGGGGPGMGIGGKVMAKKLLGAATRRGAARTGTRLGAAMGGKLLGGFGKRAGAKLGGKAIGKVAGGAIAKSLGKKIPLVGLGLGAVFAAQRAMQGDFLGAGLELASGAASTVPGLGTAGSIGIDAALAARDMTMMADGGIVDGATNAIIGEDGREGVFPLEGPRGKKTFIQFGEGILEAQKRNKKEFAKIQAAGLSEYYDKKPWWQGLMDGLKEILGAFTLPGFGKVFRFDENEDDDDDDDRAGRYKIDPSKFAKGVYGTGLVTGPAGQIGVGDEYHLDSKFSKDMSMEDRVKLMDQLARGYAARGREIEFSNNAVAGTIYDPNATLEEKIALLRKAQNAHSHSLHQNFDSIDYYIPNIGKGRRDESAEGAEILMPTMEGAQLQYGQGGGWGASVTMVDENGKVLMKTGHGDIRGAKTGTVDLSPPEETTTEPEEPKPTGNWASKLQHFGFNHSYIDFGPDNKYRALKMDNGYVIHKKGFIQRRVSTDDGANMWLMNSLLEAGNAQVKSATTTPNLDPMGDQGSLLPGDDGSNALSASSTEIALADTAASGTTVINNYTTVAGNTGNGSSTVGNQVPFGSGSSDMGGDVYSNTRIRTLVG